MEIQYGKQKRKLDTLHAEQRCENTTTSNQQEHFYPKQPTSPKKFPREELSLLNHGLQHSNKKNVEHILD